MQNTISVIKNDADHALALARLKELIIADREEDTDLMDALALLIEDYEKKMFPIPSTDAVEAILFRMEQRKITRAELARKTHIGRGHITEILQRKRGLSTKAIKAFHVELQIPLEILCMVGLQNSGQQQANFR